MVSKINQLQSSADLEGGYSQIQKTVIPFTRAKSDHLLNFLQLLKKAAMRNPLILQIISKTQHVAQPQILHIYFFQPTQLSLSVQVLGQNILCLESLLTRELKGKNQPFKII